jgi:uncharacterized repeat protein (TIGR03803 family)
LVAGVLPLPIQANAQTNFTLLHTFSTIRPSHPTSALVQASDGNYYGTSDGGIANGGTLFRLTPAGTLTILHSFSSVDGVNPQGPLIQASDGNLYGTTQLGGGGGTVFKISTSGTFTLLHSFDHSGQHHHRAMTDDELAQMRRPISSCFIRSRR